MKVQKYSFFHDCIYFSLGNNVDCGSVSRMNDNKIKLFCNLKAWRRIFSIIVILEILYKKLCCDLKHCGFFTTFKNRFNQLTTLFEPSKNIFTCQLIPFAKKNLSVWMRPSFETVNFDIKQVWYKREKSWWSHVQECAFFQPRLNFLFFPLTPQVSFYGWSFSSLVTSSYLRASEMKFFIRFPYQQSNLDL